MAHLSISGGRRPVHFNLQNRARHGCRRRTHHVDARAARPRAIGPMCMGCLRGRFSKDFKCCSLRPSARRPKVNSSTPPSLKMPCSFHQTRHVPLGPVSYSYFDPRSGTYRTVQTDRATVTIMPPGSTEANSQLLFTPRLRIPRRRPCRHGHRHAAPAAPPTAPAGIPRDPLVGTDTGLVPLGTDPWLLWLLASVLWLIPAWLILRRCVPGGRSAAGTAARARERLGQILAGMPQHPTPGADSGASRVAARDCILLAIANCRPHAAILPASLGG